MLSSRWYTNDNTSIWQMYAVLNIFIHENSWNAAIQQDEQKSKWDVQGGHNNA